MSDETKQIDDGGPAFPESGARGIAASGEGMSLRDYFAAKASEQDIQAQQEWTGNTMREGYPSNRKPKFSRSQCRYKHADAMLAARKEGVE